MSSGKISYKNIAPCLFAIVIDALGFGLVYPVLTTIFTAAESPLLAMGTSDNLRHFYLGLGFMLYPLCMFFGAAFMADLSDNYGRKKILMICMGGIALSFFAMAIAIEIQSIALLMLGRSVSGIMAGSQPIAQAAIADLSTADNKAKNMSVIALSYCIGTILGPFIGGVTSDPEVSHWFSFATPFYIATFLSVIAFVWLHFGFSETYKATAHKPIQLTRPLKIFIEAFEHRKVRTLAIVFLLMQMGFSLYFQYIIVQMEEEYAYSNALLGGMQGMIGIGFAVGLLIGIPLALKFWHILAIAIVTGLLTGLGLIIASIVTVAELQWVLAFLIAGVNIMVFTGMLTLFSDSVDKQSQGWAMGIANAVMACAWAITGLMSNLLDLITTRGLIFLGGLCLMTASLWLFKNRSYYINRSSAGNRTETHLL